jgi:hypothetical protein
MRATTAVPRAYMSLLHILYVRSPSRQFTTVYGSGRANGHTKVLASHLVGLHRGDEVRGRVPSLSRQAAH